MKNCIYKFIGENREILYIGKAHSLKHRLNTHTHLPSECYEKTKKIEYYSFDTKGDMDLAEIYYISKYKPVYNDVSKCDISITIKEFDELKFETYNDKKHFKDTTSKNTKGMMRNFELYVKNNSFESYIPKKGGKRWYRVHPNFINHEIEKFEENGIYTEYEGHEITTKFGKEYDVLQYLVYSYEDDYKFYIYSEKEIEDDGFMDLIYKRSESCNHEDTIESRRKDIVYTMCNKCGLILKSEMI